VRRAISTKFCMMIEVVRAIISPCKLFLGPINSLAARGHWKFGWKRPHRGKLFIILLFIEIKQPNLAKLCTLRTRINHVNFVKKVVQGTRPLGAIILVKFQFISVLGAVNPTPEPIKLKFGREGPFQISPWSVQRVAPAGRKNPKSVREQKQ